MKYEEDVPDDDGNLCIKSESSLQDEGEVFDFIFYIHSSHPDKEYATYHITFLVDGRIENKFSTPNLEGSLIDCISEVR